MNLKKALLGVFLVVLVLAFFVLDLKRFLSLDYLKQSQAALAVLFEQRPLAVVGSYFAIYVTATALSIPGAAIITLAGGALFGLW